MKATEPILCNREGCCNPYYARGMCEKHYGSKLKQLRREGSDLFKGIDGWAEIQKHLPGAVVTLTKATGLAHGTVVRLVREHHRAGDLHIASHNPPPGVGVRWERVYAAGAGVDHVVSQKRKRAHRQRVRNAAYKARREAAEALALSKIKPKPVTRWNLDFFNPAEIRA